MPAGCAKYQKVSHHHICNVSFESIFLVLFSSEPEARSSHHSLISPACEDEKPFRYSDASDIQMLQIITDHKYILKKVINTCRAMHMTHRHLSPKLQEGRDFCFID